MQTHISSTRDPDFDRARPRGLLHGPWLVHHDLDLHQQVHYRTSRENGYQCDPLPDSQGRAYLDLAISGKSQMNRTCISVSWNGLLSMASWAAMAFCSDRAVSMTFACMSRNASVTCPRVKELDNLLARCGNLISIEAVESAPLCDILWRGRIANILDWTNGRKRALYFNLGYGSSVSKS